MYICSDDRYQRIDILSLIDFQKAIEQSEALVAVIFYLSAFQVVYRVHKTRRISRVSIVRA